MIYKHLFSIGVVSFLIFCDIAPASLVISQPGQYGLGSTIDYTPTGNDSIIQIATSNVLLDLGGFGLQQTGGVGTLNGIDVAAGVSNVIIRHGTIKNISGTAVRINQNCKNIVIDSIQTFTINRGIWLVGNTQNCRMSNITIKFATLEGIYTSTQANFTNIDSAVIEGCGGYGIFVEGTTLNKTVGNFINNVLIAQSGNGIGLSFTDNCILKNCRVTRFGTSVVNQQYGISIIGSSGNLSRGNILQECTIENVGINSPQTAVGISLQEVSSTVMRNCITKMDANQTTQAIGIQVLSAVNGNAQAIILDNCESFGFSGSTSGYGFSLQAGRNVVAKNCQSFGSYQTTGNGSSDDFLLSSGLFYILKNCTSIYPKSSNFHLLGGNSHILTTCIGNGNNRMGYFSENAVNPLFDSCISCTVAGTGFGNGFVINNTTAGLLNNCQVVGCIGDGFTINATGANSTIQNCSATLCVNGFDNSNTTAVFYNNIATNCSTTGFFNTSPISTARYFLNEATNNTLNYSTIIPTRIAQGGAEAQGGNLTI